MDERDPFWRLDWMAMPSEERMARVSRQFLELMARIDAQRNETALVPPAPPPDKATLAVLRRTLLTHWEQLTTGRRSHLYAWRNGERPLISKNQFYSWVRGDLSPGAKATRRLERYLREQINTQISMDQNFRAT